MNFARGLHFGLMAVCAFALCALNGSPLAFAQEAGSAEKQGYIIPEPHGVFPEESGSQEKPGGVILPESKTSGIEDGKVPARPAPAGPNSSTQAESPSPERAGSSETHRLAPVLLPVLVFLTGLFLVGWLLFRMGLFNPYTATLWPKRLELCIEIALRVDDFMTAFGEENFSKCQMALDALNHLNGRRSILLSNEINAAVNKFTELAVSAKVSKAEETFQKDLNRQYEIVIEALRVGTRQEELSLEVLRSLTKAQGPHRKLKE